MRHRNVTSVNTSHSITNKQNEQTIMETNSNTAKSVTLATQPKLATTMVKVREIYRDFLDEYDRAFELGYEDRHSELETRFVHSMEDMNDALSMLMDELLKRDIANAVDRKIG